MLVGQSESAKQSHLPKAGSWRASETEQSGKDSPAAARTGCGLEKVKRLFQVLALSFKLYFSSCDITD